MMNGFARFLLPPTERFWCSSVSAEEVAAGRFPSLGNLFRETVVLLFTAGALGAPNLFALSFSPATVIPTSSGDVSVAVGDVNGDGLADLVSASAASFRVLIGNGNGTFQSPINRGNLISSINNNAIVKLADANDDQKTDIVVFSGGHAGVIPGVSGLINLFLGNGDGTFQTSIETRISVAGLPMEFVVADFNGDDLPDIVVFDQILMGDGDGTFQPAASFAGGGAHVLAADFNGDQILDLVGLYPKSESTLQAELRYSKGNGNGTFDNAVMFNLAGGSIERHTCAVTGDFNQDGKVDVAYSYSGSSVSNRGYRVLLGTGTGSFQAPVETASLTQYGVVQFCAGDFDGDGRTDVVAGNQGNLSPAVSTAGSFSNGFLDQTQPLTVFRSAGNGRFSSRGALPLAQVSNVRMLASDLNRDGRPDLVLTGTGSFTVSTSIYTLLNTTKPNPIVTLTGPRSFSTTRGRITIRGKATDTRGELARVEFKSGNAGYSTAKGTRSWSFVARLRRGRNICLVRAVDVSGIASRIVKVAVQRL